MEGHVLSKGANVSLLSRSDPSARLQAVVRWANPHGAADVDVSALLLSSDGRVRSDEDFVFYNSPSGGDGSVRLLGKRADDETGEDRVAVDLEALPADIERVVIAASLDAAEGIGFGALPELGLVLLNAEGSTSVRFDVDGVGPETAIVLGELYSRGDDWKFRDVGQGLGHGIGRSGDRLRDRGRGGTR
jgi:stress response protein SCP2